jgi:hypothetical protein
MLRKFCSFTISSTRLRSKVSTCPVSIIEARYFTPPSCHDSQFIYQPDISQSFSYKPPHYRTHNYNLQPSVLLLVPPLFPSSSPQCNLTDPSSAHPLSHHKRSLTLLRQQQTAIATATSEFEHENEHERCRQPATSTTESAKSTKVSCWFTCPHAW